MSVQLLEYFIDEPHESLNRGETIVFLHGFPDNPAVWSDTSKHLTSRGYRVVRIALPGFESYSLDSGTPRFDGTLDRLHKTLIHTGSLGTTLIGHDWGAILFYMLLLRYPMAAKRFVALEVGLAPRTWTMVCFVWLYHFLLNFAYWVGGALGDKFMQFLCWLLPRPHYRGILRPKAKHAWLYREAWRERARYGPWYLYFRNVISAWTPAAGMPFMFLYGQDGVSCLRFHSEAWCQASTSHCNQSRFRGLPGGHWFFLQNPNEFYRELDIFLANTGEISKVDSFTAS